MAKSRERVESKEEEEEEIVNISHTVYTLLFL